MSRCLWPGIVATTAAVCCAVVALEARLTGPEWFTLGMGFASVLHALVKLDERSD